MTNSQFFIQLSIVSLLTVIALFAVYLLPQIAPYQLFGWFSLAGFILLTVFFFFIGRNSANSTNKNNFTTTVLGFTMGKMFLSIIIIFSYLKLVEPTDKFFIAPFFIVYFIFTAFETYFMMKLGRSSI